MTTQRTQQQGRAGLSERLPAATRLAIRLEHLAGACGRCGRDVRRWQGEQEATAQPGFVADNWLAESTRREPEAAKRARRDVAKLLRVPAEERADLVRRSHSRLASPLVSAILMVRARENLATSAADSEHLLRIAQQVAARSTWADIHALATAELGNAQRVQGRLARAESCFAEARKLQRLAPVGELLSAEIDHLEGSLRRDQRRLREAHNLLSHAVVGFERAGFRPGRIRATLNLGDVLRMLGAPEDAGEAMLDVLHRVHPASEPHLHLIACHNFALCAVDAENPKEARDLLQDLEPLYRRFGKRADHARRTWLLGRIARDLGRLEEAAALLRHAVDELAEMKNPLLCGCAAVDLAEALLSLGGRGLQQLTGAIALVLRAENLHDEVAASMLLLQRAIAYGKVDAQLLRVVRARVAAAPAAAG